MKVLFAALHFANYRNFESVVRELAAAGHQVHLTAEEPESLGGAQLVERLAQECRGVTWGFLPPLSDPWLPFVRKIRHGVEHVRFLAPEYAGATKLRVRSAERTPRLVRWLASSGPLAIVGQRRVLEVLTHLEKHVPVSETLQTFLAEAKPDVVVVTALTVGRSMQVHLLNAAHALGIRTVGAVLSWDHLSSKALVHVPPQRTLVWNDTQRQEAVRMHGLRDADVVATGAQCYDQWFDRSPSRSRDAFCAHLGLDPSRRIVLYVCSTMSPPPDPLEPVFVREWAQAVRRSSDPDLRKATLIVRPHPERVREWRNVTLDDIDHVVLHGRSPIDAEAKADYFDSLHHSDAVVGLCTSAFIEAAIVGRPVLTLLLPAFRLHQEEMAHFRYLQTVGGGLLHTAGTVPEHLTQLAEALRGRGSREERNRRFLIEFVRPRGLDVPATPSFVSELTALHMLPESHAVARRDSVSKTVVVGLARLAETAPGRWLMRDRVEDARVQSEQQRAEVKEEVVSAREQYRSDKVRRAGTLARDKAREQRRKALARWWRGLSARKQLARLKGGVKQVLGERMP
jgi:hypothetical protein